MLSHLECLEEVEKFEAAVERAKDEWTRKALERLIEVWRGLAEEARQRETAES